MPAVPAPMMTMSQESMRNLVELKWWAILTGGTDTSYEHRPQTRTHHRAPANTQTLNPVNHPPTSR